MRDAAYILDTSALFTLIEDEDGAEIVSGLLQRAEREEIGIYVSFVSLTEVYYITLQEKGEVEALRRVDLMRSLAVNISESNDDVNLKAGTLKAHHRISLADAYIAALCIAKGGILVHKDPEFEQLSAVLKEWRLPYKAT